MNELLHPDWHNDEEPVPVTVTQKQSPRPTQTTHVPVAAASRMPAAIAGILFFTAIGMTAVGGWQALGGQVSSGSTSSTSTSSSKGTTAPVQIRITPSGFVPPDATVKPGQQIIWINEQAIPHILTSQTLRDTSGSYLNTPAIFPGAQTMFTVGTFETDKQHSVTSTTDTTLVGTVTVRTGSAIASTKTPAKPFGTLDDLPTVGGKSSAGGTIAKAGSTSSSRSSSMSNSKTRAPSSAPTASNTVALTDTSSTHLSADGTDPNSASNLGASIVPGQAPGSQTLDSFGDAGILPPPVMNTPENQISPSRPDVIVQPETGPEVWIVVFLSIVGLSFATRGYFSSLNRGKN